jgi:hypothetical protein
MKTYLAKWPDGTISILQANTMIDLFWDLDMEANPLSAKLYELPKRFQLTTTIKDGEIEIDEIFPRTNYKDLKEIFFPLNIVGDAHLQILDTGIRATQSKLFEGLMS